MDFKPGDRVVIHPIASGYGDKFPEWEGVTGTVLEPRTPDGHIKVEHDTPVKDWRWPYANHNPTWVHPLEPDTPFLADLRSYISEAKRELGI